MKNRDLMIAGSFLLGLGLTAQAQEKNADQLFFYGFEDNLSSFTDSSKPLDSIKTLRYYTKEDGGNGQFEVEKWTLDPVVYDTSLVLLNGIQPCQGNDPKVRANDTYECFYEPTDAHQKKMEELGAIGGHYYLHFKTDKNVDQSSDDAKKKESGDYQGCLFIRNIPIQDSTSYRLVYYRKTGQPDKAKMYSGILRGFYNSEKSISMNGDGGNEFMRHDENGIKDSWERVTVMTYYQNDSVANRHCYKSGYWWSSSWKRQASNGEERVYIEQPDKFFVRLTFSAPEVDYFVDDIALYKSWIGGAEYNNDVIRINFGYDTNLKELAAASPLKSIELPGKYFTITGIDSFSTGRDFESGETDEAFRERGGTYERSDIPALSAEYHDDGYMYIFLAPDGDGYVQDCGYYGDVRISFTNPTDNPNMTLKYDGTLYPMSLDTIWAKTKIVPNFTNEFVLPNKGVIATPVAKLAPTAIKMNPVDGSFKLDPATTSIKVFFNKPVYVDTDHETVNGVKAVFSKSGSEPETWFASPFNAADSSVVFTRESSTPLSGEYQIDIFQARAASSFPAAPTKSFSLYFGFEISKSAVNKETKFNGYETNYATPEGFSVNKACMMKVGEFGGLFSKALMFGLYGANLTNNGGSEGDGKGPVLTYQFYVPEACEKEVSFGASGCQKGSWNDAADMDFYVLDTDMKTVIKKESLGGSSIKPSEGGPVTDVDSFAYTISFPAAGTYYLQWSLPKENSWGGGHKGGRVLYYVNVPTVSASCYKYIAKVDNAFDLAQSMKLKAEATLIKYDGSVLDALKEVIGQFDGFTTSTDPYYTEPAQYNNAASALSNATSAMGARIDSVNLYYKEYDNCDSIVKSYNGNDTANVAVVIAAKELLTSHASLEMPETEPAQLRVIIKNIQDATKAINDRKALNNKFLKLVKAVSDTIDHKSAYDFFAEYPAMTSAYNSNKNQDIITGTDAEVNAAINAMQDALNTFNGKLEGALGMANQAKLLVALATKLGIDFDALSAGSSAKITEIMYKLDGDNAGLVDALKLAIKAKMYEMIDAGTLPSDLDLSGFIKNPGLYGMGVIGVDVEYYNYTYGGAKDRWRAKKGTYTNVYPGWSIKVEGGNVHFAYEQRNWNGAAAVYDGYVAADWNSGFSMTQTVEDLPLGKYSIGVAYNNDNNGKTDAKYKDNTLIVSTPGVDTVYRDTVIAVDGDGVYNPTANMFSDDMSVSTGSVTISLNHASGEGWARVDNFGLTFKESIDGVDYAALIADLNTQAAAAINEVVTGVESVTVSGSVEYYNLNGIRLAAPQKGINIKVTTGADGKRVSEKILVK